MNYMPEVAKMLGVEIGEEFEIDSFSGFYKITEEDGCISETETFTINAHLFGILSGQFEIKRKPWIPKYGERYWYPCLCAAYLAESTHNNHSSFDDTRIERKIVFRTKEEAVQAAKKMLKALEEGK